MKSKNNNFIVYDEFFPMVKDDTDKKIDTKINFQMQLSLTGKVKNYQIPEREIK